MGPVFLGRVVSARDGESAVRCEEGERNEVATRHGGAGLVALATSPMGDGECWELRLIVIEEIAGGDGGMCAWGGWICAGVRFQPRASKLIQ